MSRCLLDRPGVVAVAVLQSLQASRYLSRGVEWSPVVQCSWDRLTNSAGGRRACGEGQGLQSRVCCKCNAN